MMVDMLVEAGKGDYGFSFLWITELEKGLD